MLKAGFWRHFDFLLLGSVILAIAFGVAMIRSAIAGNETLAELVSRQIIFAAIGLGVILMVAIIDYHYWAASNRIIYVVMILLLLLNYVVGNVRFGAARWIETGLVSIQPAELAKVVSILVLAYYFHQTRNSTRDLKWVAQSLILTVGLAIWIFLQPNLSNTIVILVIWAAMLFLSGLPVKYLLIILLIAPLLVVATFPALETYQQQRIITFLFPDPEARYGATYNVQQALIAIGSGGLFGTGYGQGSQVQLRFLKVRHTDFIFSAISQEFGLIGALFVIVLIMVIILRCLRAARLANDLFGSLIAYGVAVQLFFQSAVNIAVNLNVIPVTGLPLPFISYGGSGLLSLMLGIGLVESVIMRHKALEF